MKHINLNCITNSCNWYTYVTWRGNEYELSEDEHDSVETCSNVIIYKLIVIVLFCWLFHKIIKLKKATRILVFVGDEGESWTERVWKQSSGQSSNGS